MPVNITNSDHITIVLSVERLTVAVECLWSFHTYNGLELKSEFSCYSTSVASWCNLWSGSLFQLWSVAAGQGASLLVPLATGTCDGDVNLYCQRPVQSTQ